MVICRIVPRLDWNAPWPVLPPFEANLKKRLVRAPKVYLHDSGILHALLEIEDFDHLLAHPQVGESWEGFIIEQLLAVMPRWRPAFLRTSNGAEVDLVLERGERRLIFEIKLSKAPQPSRGGSHAGWRTATGSGDDYRAD